MPTITDFATTLAFFTRVPAASVVNKARKLREAGLLPNAGRGRAAAQIGPGHAATLVVGLMAEESVSDTVDAAIRYMRLPTTDASGYGFAGAKTFVEAVEAILAKQDVAELVEEVCVERAFPQASITWRTEEGGPTQTAYYAPAGKHQESRAHLHVTACLGGAFWSQAAIDLTDDEDGDWTENPGAKYAED